MSSENASGKGMSIPGGSKVQPVSVGSARIGPGCGLVLIAGPCVIESRDHTLKLAEAIRKIAEAAKVPLIFKASYDKANRSSAHSFRGPGLEEGLKILSEVRSKVGLPVTADVHWPHESAPAAQALNLLQIPAFLCRQTDLLVAAGRTGKPVNVKKGQFMAPEQMRLAVQKVTESGASGVLLTERGTFFGYGKLVNDMTAIPTMSAFAPVVFDATHSCQCPGEAGTHSGGRREMVPTLARAGIAAGAHALFLEVHDTPAAAKSDPATVWPLDQLAGLLDSCRRVYEGVK
ncbi:MAG TPA: 3-deoxy-8-phosphooctulonate synthase [Phycisphaerae bacterium]|nr:3-deoxy-8-phosphooctulonate synthase [Phycisphaerae bacterium]